MLSVAIGLLLAWIGIFELPYCFPPTEPTAWSESYSSGFNNRVSVLATLAIIGAFCWRNYTWRPRAPEPVDTLIIDDSREGRIRTKMPKAVLLLLAAIHAISAFLIFHCLPYLDEYGEPYNLLPRILVGLRHGLAPFRDIGWNYGPGLYYIPQAFIAMGSRFGANSDLSYFLAYLCCSLLGIWALFYVVDSLRIRRGLRVLVFSILVLVTDDLTLGVQYTLLRFITPFAAMLVVHRMAADAMSAGKGRRLWRVYATAAIAVAVVLSISTEIGIVYAVAQTAYFVHRALFFRRVWVCGSIITAATAVVLVLGIPGTLDGLTAFSKGACNFPVYFAAHTVVYVVSLFWVLPILLRGCLSLRPRSNVSLLLAWSGLTIGMIPGALGRCDAGHVFFYGIGAFLLTMATMARFRRELLVIYAIVFFAVFGIEMRLIGYASYGDFLAPVLKVIQGDGVERVPHCAAVDELHLDTFKSIASPFDCDRDMRRYLIDSGRLAPLYHLDLLSVCTVRDIERMVRDLKKARVVLALHFPKN
jgi:hypothetical protein